MAFYERYALICAEKGIDPCSEKTAQMLGVTRATISQWGRKNTAPKGETVAVIADKLNVSADYLLGRTDCSDDVKDDSLKSLFDKLDEIDRAKAEAYMTALLSADKYKA